MFTLKIQMMCVRANVFYNSSTPLKFTHTVLCLLSHFLGYTLTNTVKKIENILGERLLS